MKAAYAQARGVAAGAKAEKEAAVAAAADIEGGARSQALPHRRGRAGAHGGCIEGAAGGGAALEGARGGGA